MPPGGPLLNMSGMAAYISSITSVGRITASQSLQDNGAGDALAFVYQSRLESNGTADEKQRLLNTILVGVLHEVGRRVFTISFYRRGI